MMGFRSREKNAQVARQLIRFHLWVHVVVFSCACFRAHGIVGLEKALELYEKYYLIELQKESHEVQLKILKMLNELGEIQKKLSEKPSSFALIPINTQSKSLEREI